MKQESCPLCKWTPGEEQISKARYVAPEYRVLSCLNCGHFFTYFEKEVSESIYEDERYKVVDNRESLFDKILGVEYGRVVVNIKKIMPAAKSVLDFGCGKGKFLSLCRESGLSVKGVETSKPRAEFAAQHYHLDIDSSHYDSGKIAGGPFDVITLFHVLEHLTTPGELLSQLIANNLVEGGLLVIEVPNRNSWQSKWSGSKWLQLDVPRHVSHFDTARLRKLLDSLGLRVERVTFFSIHLGFLGMLRTCLGKLGYNGDIIYSLKNEKNPGLYALIALVLPFAVLLETISCLFSKGGIVRIYASKKK